LLSQKDKLDSFAKAALAIALHTAGDSASANSLADQLIAQAETLPTTAFWPADTTKTDYHWRTMSSAEKNTAMVLRALMVLRPNQPILPKAINWLMEHRRGGGWRDTQATAFTILALTDYIQLSGELQADYRYIVSLNGLPVANGQVTSNNVLQPIEPITISGSKLQDGRNQIRIVRYGTEGQLYYSIALRQELFYDKFESVSSKDQGLAVKRSYRKVSGDKNSTDFAIGDLVEVELTVTAKDEAWYVLLEDPLPAGFEALNERLNTVAYNGTSEPFYWYSWGYNRKNIYDDHVTFFMTQLWPGERSYTYLMRATTAGEFSVPPAEIYPMYDEDIWGRSGSIQVKVAPNTLHDRPELLGDFDNDCRLTQFDLRQVAGAWITDDDGGDLNNNGRIDLADVSVISRQKGQDCLVTPQTPPGASKDQAQFAFVSEATDVQAGQVITVQVALQTLTHTAGGGLGGFGTKLSFKPSLFQVSEIDWNPAISETLSSQIDNETGHLVLGSLNLPTGTLAGSRLVTVTFTSQQAGPMEFNSISTEAVNGQGELLEASSSVTNLLMIDRVYLPVLLRR
jgi:hypothetical protein